MKLRTQPSPQIRTQCYMPFVCTVYTRVSKWGLGCILSFIKNYTIHVHIKKAHKTVWLGVWRLDLDLRFIIQRVHPKSLYDRVPVSTLHPHIRTQLHSLHPPVTNLLMYWSLPILQASHNGAMWYKHLYAPLSVETCMNNSILQDHDMLVGYILIVGIA